MNPKNPIHADSRCTMGLSKTLDAFPILCRNDIRVDMKKNTMENVRATAMNAGVAMPGGEIKKLGALLGRAERSEAMDEN